MDKDFKKAADASDKDIPRAYKKAVLDVPCKFLVLPTRSDMWWHEYNARERIGLQFRMVCRTAYQRVCGVIRVIHDMASSAGRDAATQARVVALHQGTAAHMEQLSSDTADKETFIRE